MRLSVYHADPALARRLADDIAVTRRHTVTWIASNPARLLERCAELEPQLLVLDIDGSDAVVEMVTTIRRTTSAPILLVTRSLRDRASEIFESLGAGASDAVEVVIGGHGHQLETLLEKITNLQACARHAATAPLAPAFRNALICVGTSTGGPGALRTLLGELPRDLPAAVVVVQHLDERFAGELAAWLDRQVALEVVTARSRDRPVPGRVLVASTNRHLVMRSRGRLHYTEDDLGLSYSPSVDVFFESAARHWRGELTGVILTGMGDDGARGLLAIHEAGGHTIAQDQSSSKIFGMPKAAIELGAAVAVLPLEEIADVLVGTLCR